MESQIHAAARQLAQGDPLGALGRVALRQDPPALALRGTAMAQLGALETATALLRRAERGFGLGEELNRARCTLARLEVAIAQRDFGFRERDFMEAHATFVRHGDESNGHLAQLLTARHQLLIGKITRAERSLDPLDFDALPSALAGLGRLLQARVAIRRIAARKAERLVALAAQHAAQSGISALEREIEQTRRVLKAPAGRVLSETGGQSLLLSDVERLLELPGLLVDACRRQLTFQRQTIGLSKRPVLFALIERLASEPRLEASREQLVRYAFESKACNESHRARLRVEIGRLRALLRGVAGITATRAGYQLLPHRSAAVRLLLPPLTGPHADVLALLSDGQAWSTASIALALGKSQRSVQRACRALRSEAALVALGRGPYQRWLSASLQPIAPALLLPCGARERYAPGE